MYLHVGVVEKIIIQDSRLHILYLVDVVARNCRSFYNIDKDLSLNDPCTSAIVQNYT